MIHIKAYPPRILYQSPYRSAQISDLADIHLTFRFQAALPVIISPAQRSSKTGRRAQSEIIFQAILPRFYFGKFLTKLQIWHEFHSHFFCFLSLYDTTGTVVLILSVLLFNLQPVLFPLHFPRHPSVPGFLHGVHPKVNLCCICNTSHSHFPAGTQCCTHYC